MKKLMALMVAAMFTIGTMAQTEQKQTTTKHTSTTVSKSTNMKASECYMMKDNALMHCWSTKSEAQKTNVTLTNGTKISTNGEITMTDGKSQMLTNGQCIDMKGMIGDCDKMMGDMKHDKMNNSSGEHKDY